MNTDTQKQKPVPRLLDILRFFNEQQSLKESEYIYSNEILS